MIALAQTQPFARGGNRLCFVHPQDAHRCIKVRRPDFSLADRRRKKGFPKNLKPLSSFDDNREEWGVMQSLNRNLGEAVYQCVSRCYGFVETDMGKGLCSELIRNGDGTIAQTLKKELWDAGFSDELRQAVADFVQRWEAVGVPSRDLLLHNLVVQRERESISRIVVIDGLGSQGLVPFFWLPRAVRQKKIARKVANLYQRIDKLLGQRGQKEFPGYHGLLFHNDAPPSNQGNSSQ
ncbi:PhoP regulatory network YrbL family protein [Simiduia sp. 21SJ11W-1]|uniref:YrbL family protein n=1 Tax=Simiduia sp. 21SJ11W-1 TaxID=2909669 RepID=UPI00209C9160|nr:YrbL family protein [Simiduia sp. 21SJ11W-1]UTA48003.1 PhoP regulatory network YrbL family protein [Simiduia sp. 21SJ11W-1]